MKKQMLFFFKYKKFKVNSLCFLLTLQCKYLMNLPEVGCRTREKIHSENSQFFGFSLLNERKFSRMHTHHFQLNAEIMKNILHVLIGNKAMYPSYERRKASSQTQKKILNEDTNFLVSWLSTRRQTWFMLSIVLEIFSISSEQKKQKEMENSFNEKWKKFNNFYLVE